MTNKNLTILVIVGIVLIGIGSFVFKPKDSSARGNIVFGITDAAEDMGDISSVVITVNKVEIRSATNGWIAVSTTTKAYDLLALKQSGKVSLLVNTTVASGTYDQVRLNVSSVVVTRNGVAQEAKLPSSELKISGTIEVMADQSLSVVFDFIADKSIHITGDGKIIFAPVIKVTRQNNIDFELRSNDEIVIKIKSFDDDDGKDDDGDGKDDEEDDDINSQNKNYEEHNYGMDERGEVRSDFELKGLFKIDNDDKILLDAGLDDQSDGKSDDENGDDN